ncbi:hypothetical protein P872_02045 [Rhodonellum psychrophilum GCM71 = DSM 17998]|uniref:Uncharacterized protein n=1 Tax=Rhodonellum psychrophilum GCM71 = DSM 17998 TaxID=1123057 RepID=U5C4I2_9BACT|nr:hypothetical protein P872_02045 [Rhodonellum psychrophilum GCM71 = DSM 17998]
MGKIFLYRASLIPFLQPWDFYPLRDEKLPKIGSKDVFNQDQ